MLVAVLKGHTSRVIGCDFLGMNNLLSVDETGILNIFNFKVPNPIASQMINKAKFKEVAFFTNKQQFALLSIDNRIFIVQIQNVILIRIISNLNLLLPKSSFCLIVLTVLIWVHSVETPTFCSFLVKARKSG